MTYPTSQNDNTYNQNRDSFVSVFSIDLSNPAHIYNAKLKYNCGATDKSRTGCGSIRLKLEKEK